MAYRHGVYISEQATSIVSTADVDAGLPVVIGTAPGASNEPTLVSSYNEAIQACGGYVGAGADGLHAFTLCEFVKCYHVNSSLSQAILINIFDASKHVAESDNEAIAGQMEGGKATIDTPNQAVLKSVKVGSNVVSESEYSVTYGAKSITIERASNATVLQDDSEISVITRDVDLSKVEASDITEAIAKIDEIYPRYALVPGQILCPKYSVFPSIQAAMASKANKLNGGTYSCVCLVDIATFADKLKNGELTEACTPATSYTAVAAAKSGAGATDKTQIVCWPLAKLGSEIYHLSTVAACTVCTTDADNEGIPYASPSNHAAKVNGACILKDGTSVVDVWMDQTNANTIDGNGVVTLLRRTAGWMLWGNNTGCYPGNTDVKDYFIPVRRMFSWVGNTLVNTFFQKVDAPLNKAQIERIRDSANMWLNGLVGGGYLVAGRVEFNESENSAQSLMSGIAKFHVYLTPPSPNREIDFVLEYDATSYSAVFE